MNIKLLDEVSFIDTETGIPSLKRGRIIKIFSSTIEKYDVSLKEEAPQEVIKTVVIQESEIIKDDKDKDVVTYGRRSYSKQSSDIFISDSDAKQYMRDLFA